MRSRTRVRSPGFIATYASQFRQRLGRTLATIDREALRARANLGLDVVLALSATAIALLMRLSYVRFALPYAAMWDEVFTWGTSLELLAKPGLRPVAFDGIGFVYGDLLVYLSAAAQALGFLTSLRAGRVSSITEYTSAPAGVGPLMWAVAADGMPLLYPRVLVAFLASLGCLAIYAYVRGMLKAPSLIAFGATLIYAVFSYDVVLHAGYVWSDAIPAALFSLVLLCAARIIHARDDSTRSYALLGALAGLMLSIKLTYPAVMVFPLLVPFLAKRRDQALTNLGVGLLSVVLAFFITSPYWLIDLPSHLSRFEYAGRVYGGVPSPDRLTAIMPYYQMLFIRESSLGPCVGLLALVGVVRFMLGRPREFVLMFLFVAGYLYFITDVPQWYPRYILVLSPIASIWAGAGLDLVAKLLRSVALWGSRPHGWAAFGQRRRLVVTLGALVPPLALVLLLVFSSTQIQYSIAQARVAAAYQAPQVAATEYLRETMIPGDKLGIFDFFPWVERDLQKANIPFERIKITDSSCELNARGITYVAGTDVLHHPAGFYPFSPIENLSGTIWDSYLKQPGAKLAEYGTQSVSSWGAPLSDPYLFISRVPTDQREIIKVPLDPLNVPGLGYVAPSDGVTDLPAIVLDRGRYQLHLVVRGDEGGPPGQMRRPAFGMSLTLQGASTPPAGLATPQDFDDVAGSEITVSQPCMPVAVQLIFQDNVCHECTDGIVEGDRNVWFKDLFFKRIGS